MDLYGLNNGWLELKNTITGLNSAIKNEVILLQTNRVIINTIFGNKLIVTPLFHHLAFLKNYYSVRQAVGND